MPIRPLLIALLCVMTSRAFAGELHVSPEPLPGFADTAQHRTVQAAVDAAGPGDTVTLYTGTYREEVIINHGGTREQPLRIQAAEGAKVVLTGADRLTNWKSEGDGVFSHPWDHVFLKNSDRRAHPDDERHRLIGRVEQVIDQGRLLRQVLQREHVAPGTFFIDEKGKRLYAAPADLGDYTAEDRVVEASTRSRVLFVRAPHVEIQGLTIRYAANAAQFGAAVFDAEDVIARGCTFELSSGAGATVTSPGVTLDQSAFRENGQIGLSASGCHDLVILGCTFTRNNTEGFDIGWEAGGFKVTLTRGVEVRHSVASNNRGPGMWFDIGCEATLVANCQLNDNDGAGLFYEISYGLRAIDNTALYNGLADTPGQWGAQAGITISSSQGCVIENNTLIGNREGLALREQDRTTPRIDGGDKEVPIQIRDLRVTNNTIALNQEAQVRGWFDIDDNRHWPPNLAKLDLVFTGNTFKHHPGQPLWTWGTSWRKNATYDTPEEVERALILTAPKPEERSR